MLRIRYRDLRLRNKLLLLYIGAVFIPVVLTNVYFYSSISENVKREKRDDLSQAMDAKIESFRTMIDDLVGISSILYTDSLLNESLDREYSSTLEFVNAYNEMVNRSFYRFIPINNLLYNDAYIYSDNPTLVNSGILRELNEETKREEWYAPLSELDEMGAVYVWDSTSSSAMPGQAGPRSISIARQLDYIRGNSTYEKILRIDINQNVLERILLDRHDPRQIQLIDPDGNVIVSSLNGGQGGRQEDEIRITRTLQNVRYLQGWSLTGVDTDTNMLHALLNARQTIIYLTCINLLLPSLIIILISRSLNVRIVKLLKYMKKMKNQHFDTVPDDTGADEIGQLTIEFNRMSSQIQRLIRDIYEVELDRRQAHINALQSQINPHFLFNTLESIRMGSVIKEEDETARVIKLLAKSLRRALMWGEDFVPVSEEITFAVEFMEIYKYRFPDTFDYRLVVSSGVEPVRIPKMCVQPLVENACLHGIERIAGKGTVTVSVAAEGGRLVIVVDDSGKGMEPEELAGVLRRLQNDADGSGVGLANVYRRLRFHYGDAFEFRLKSLPDIGTRAELRLPIHYVAKG